MVVGRTLAAVTALTRAIAAREVQRRYLAIAHGTPARERWTHRGADRPRSEGADADGGRRVGQAGANRRRAHRRRATASRRCAARCTAGARTRSGSTSRAQGLPLVGDRLYGGAPALGMERQALHAARLAFRHPRSGARAGASNRRRRETSLTPGPRSSRRADPELAPAAAPAGTMRPFPFDAKGSCGGETPGRTPRRDHRDVTAPEGASNRGGPPRRTRRVPRRARPPRRDAAEDFTTT